MLYPQHITTVQHPLIHHLVALRNQRGYRTQEGTCLIEGIKAVNDLPPETVVHYFVAEKVEFNPKQSAPVIVLSDHLIKKVSGVKTPDGVLAEVKMPLYKTLKGPLPSLLVLDRLQDPGNIGTLLRTAFAFGWHHIAFTSGTCDPFHDKVLRAGRGVHFSLNFYETNIAALQKWSEEEKGTVLIADLIGTPCDQLSIPKCPVMILGHEGQGVSPDFSSFAQAVTLSMVHGIDSLNVAVAGSILLYLWRQSDG